MKKWFLNLNQDELDHFRQTSQFQTLELNFDSNAILLKKYLSQQIKLEPDVERLDQYARENGFNDQVVLYENNSFEENFILDHRKNLFVRHFFFQTLTPRLKKELQSFIFFHQVFHSLELSNLTLHLIDTLPPFLENRTQILSNEEYHQLYGQLEKKEALLGLLFISLIHYSQYQDKLNLIEKKNLKETFFTHKVKKILELKENDYDYIQKSVLITDLPEQDQKKFELVSQTIETQKIPMVDYIEHHLASKKILFWCLWAISPFLAWDVSRLISILNQFKNIKKIYLDLPKGSQEKIDRYINHHPIDEDKMDHEIKKIYPNIIDDYAKETLPYLKLLERIHYFNLPSTLFGLDGEQLIGRTPILKQEKLTFEMDREWRACIQLEYQNLEHLDPDDLVIFFYFLKPMYYFPAHIAEHKEVETLIHTDPFTGFGPQKFENLLSLYSHYQKIKNNSFFFPDLKNSIFGADKIIFFPYQDKHFFKLNENLFNQFNLFNSLLYSTTKGNGGDSPSNFVPFSPDQHTVHS